MARFLDRSLWWRGLYVVSAVAALAVLLLVATGLLLNHRADLGLDRAPVEHPWLRSFYGTPAVAEAAPGLAHRLPTGDLAVQDGQLRLNDKVLGDCPRLIGVVEQPGQILAACSNRLILLTPEGELIRQADTLRSIPDGLSAVGRRGDEVLVRQGESTFSVNLGDLSVTPASPDGQGQSPETTVGGEAADVAWEQVVLDLHSGRVFGRHGPWFMDALALLFTVLALSGLVLFWRRRAP